MGRSVAYSNKETLMIEAGAEAIEKVLSGPDMEAKERLLLCLDKFMDPWFGYDLPDLPEIKLLLQKVIADTNSISVKEDAINLLSSYTWPPFPVLQEKYEQIEDELKPEIDYLLNMDQDI